jgi:hypothetical protein
MLAWYGLGYTQATKSEVVNYADDFVIPCKPGHGEQAMAAMRRLMDKLGLTVNEKKTRLVKWPEERFDFLGYTVGQMYGKDGRPYWGTKTSVKSVKRLIREIRESTTSQWNATSVQSRVERLNPMIRGWANNFSQGPVGKVYRFFDEYTARRLRIWLTLQTPTKHEQLSLL